VTRAVVAAHVNRFPLLPLGRTDPDDSLVLEALKSSSLLRAISSFDQILRRNY